MGRLVLNHSTNLEGLIPLLRKLARHKDIGTVTPACISKVKGKSTNFTVRISVRTISGYKAIARKGQTAQEIFITTNLSKDELKTLLDSYYKK